MNDLDFKMATAVRRAPRGDRDGESNKAMNFSRPIWWLSVVDAFTGKGDI